MKAFIVFAACLGVAAALAPLPGADIMSKGLNMVNGSQVELLPIFEWQYTQGKTYAPDPENPQTEYKVPDGLVVTELDETRELVNEELLMTFDQWIETERTSFSVDVGVQINMPGSKALSGDVKYDRESYKMHEVLKNKTTASGFSRKWYAYFQLEAYPPEFLTLNPMFSRIVDELPPSIKTGADQAKYNELIQYFGSHFVMNSKFGGQIHVDTFISKSFMASKSQQWVDQQFSLSLHYAIFDISTGGFKNKSSIHIDQSFQRAATTDIFYAGGDPALQTNMTLPQWVKSIPTHPHYMNCTISDISTLVTDKTKAATLQNVIKVFIQTGKLPKVGDDVDYAALYAPDPRRDALAIKRKA
jgi:hypothetical protein